MKKFLFGTLFSVFLLSICFSFGLLTPNVVAQGIVTENPLAIHLVGKDNDGIFSLFNSIVQSGVSEQAVSYYDKDGNLVTNRRAITKVLTDYFLSQKAYGNSNYELPEDLKKIADVATLKVNATAGHLALSADERDKVVFQLIVDENVQSQTSAEIHFSGALIPNWIKTNSVVVNSNSIIQFNYETRDGYGTDKSKGFYIFDPCLNFSIEIPEITTYLKSKEVFTGEKIFLNATNKVQDLLGGEILDYYKNYFKIEWEIVDGSAFAEIENDMLKITGTPGNSVSIRAKCKASSLSEEYLYSEVIKYNISSEKGVGIISNFSEALEEVSIISENSNTTISFKLKDGYRYENAKYSDGRAAGFNKEGELYSGKFRNTYLSISEMFIINLTKLVSIEQIIVKDKIYDKTNSADIYNIVIDKRFSDDVYVSGFSAEFSSASAGSLPIITGMPILEGKDAKNYELVSATLPAPTGQILKRDVVVNAKPAEQIFKKEPATIEYESFGLLEGESFSGSLSREPGEEVGNYRITLGTLKNSNYNIILNSNLYRINKRKIEITEVLIQGKTYDKTTDIDKADVTITYSKEEIIEGHSVGIEFGASYINSDIGDKESSFLKEVVFRAYLIGADKNSYEIVFSCGNIYGAISPKELVVSASEISKQFGDSDPELIFSYDEMFEGDSFQGTLERETGENVGQYLIKLGTLSAKNYNIFFNSANLNIAPREIRVVALNAQKIYGNPDPELTYSIIQGNLVENQPLNLDLYRTKGEFVGNYNIFYYDTYNKNYSILYAQEGFEILQREVIVNLSAKEKEYDATTNAEIIYVIQNNILENPDNLKLNENLTAMFDAQTVGEQTLTYYFNQQQITQFTSQLISGSNLNCYKFVFNVSSNSKINVREVLIKVAPDATILKEYGNSDPEEIKYVIENGFDLLSLNGKLEREKGEEVKSYLITLGTINSNTNPNYTISLFGTNYFTITKRRVVIVSSNNEKIYGEEDPKIVYSLKETTPLPSGIILEKILIGSPARVAGENCATYSHTIGNLTFSPEEISRYELIFEAGNLTISKRDLSIIINNKTKEYGNATPTLTYTVVSGSLAFDSDLTLSVSTTENVGNYEITAQINLNNYNFSCENGTLTISPAPITLEAINSSKTYGNRDPSFSCQVSKGTLKLNDTINGILAGSLSREQGENVGFYSIQQGTLIANKNYSLTFVEATFEITKRDVAVSANPLKIFLDEIGGEVNLTYSATGLIGEDGFSGALEVSELSGLGVFPIGRGTLNNPNYNIIYTPENVSVVKRKLKITVNPESKFYDGNSSITALTYSLSGDIKSTHQSQYFGVSLSCFPSKNAGKYPISASYSQEQVNALYDVEIENNNFEIKKRPLLITSKNITITYGEEVPNVEDWAYTVDGEILNNEVGIYLSSQANKNAGKFPIVANFSGAENYEITYNAGIIEILKKDLEITLYSASKTYGETDPDFVYQVGQGLLEGDKISGKITRAFGKNVGTYKLICSLVNSNYNFIVNDAFLTINPRQLNISFVVKDKVFDGTTNVSITSTLANFVKDDDLSFIFEASFVDSEVGNNKKINLNSYSLSGQDSKNYILNLQSEISANITNKFITDGTVTISVEDNNTALTADVTLNVMYLNGSETGTISWNKETQRGIVVQLLKDGKVLTEYGEVEVKISTQDFNFESYEVFMQKENNWKKHLFNLVGDNITFKTSSLGKYAIVTNKNVDWVYATIGIGSAAFVGATVTGTILIIKKFKAKKSSKQK